MSDDDPKNGRVTCTAHNRQGKRCGRSPVPGATVCRNHGGAAPQVQRAARLRLLELVDPAIATLAREMVNADKSGDRQRAANSILDRAGLARQTEVNTTDAAELLKQRLAEAKARRDAALLNDTTDHDDV